MFNNRVHLYLEGMTAGTNQIAPHSDRKPCAPLMAPIEVINSSIAENDIVAVLGVCSIEAGLDSIAFIDQSFRLPRGFLGISNIRIKLFKMGPPNLIFHKDMLEANLGFRIEAVYNSSNNLSFPWMFNSLDENHP